MVMCVCVSCGVCKVAVVELSKWVNLTSRRKQLFTGRPLFFSSFWTRSVFVCARRKPENYTGLLWENWNVPTYYTHKYATERQMPFERWFLNFSRWFSVWSFLWGCLSTAFSNHFDLFSISSSTFIFFYMYTIITYLHVFELHICICYRYIIHKYVHTYISYQIS